MEDRIRSQLYARNSRIINAIKTKAERVCPGVVDLIAVTGSFCSGDFYEKSDLDLLIVINDKSGWSLAKCFVLGDTAHDIYCHTWEQLEYMSEYRDPYVMKLINVDIVYCTSDEVLRRYNRLSEALTERLAAPLDRDTLANIRTHYDSALREYGRMCVTDTPARCKYISAVVIYYIEYVIYMLNKEYIHHGVKGIPEEICTLKLLPDGFRELYFALIYENDVYELRRLAGMLVKRTGELISSAERKLGPLPHPEADQIRGTYEEIYSNWKNKLHRAADIDDTYLSFMSTASCQNFYDELSESYDIGSFALFEGWRSDDLEASANYFDKMLEEYRRNYDRAGLDICRYDDIDEFERDYIGGIA